jgi:outer membrane lipoprotein-sorting protein
MKKTIALLSAILFLGALLPTQTLDEILARNYKSNGGLDKLKAVTAMKISGKIVIPAQGLEMPTVMWKKHPNKMRVETTFQDKKIVQAYDGRKAWWIMPFLSADAQEMAQEQAEPFVEQADFENPLLVFKEKGYKLELLGKEDIEGTPVFKLKLTKTDGREIFFYLDADSGLELKSTLTTKTGETETLNEILYRDYKPVDGVMLPFTVENRMNGKTEMQMTMESIEINPAMDDAMFAMPQKKEAAKTNGQ